MPTEVIATPRADQQMAELAATMTRTRFLNIYAELYRLSGVEPPDSAGRAIAKFENIKVEQNIDLAMTW